jgi:hypothetical protein
MLTARKLITLFHPRIFAGEKSTSIVVAKGHVIAAVVVSHYLGFEAADMIPNQTPTHRTDAGFAVADPVQHAPNCEHVDCFAVRPFLEVSESVYHDCCMAQSLDETMQEWMKPKEHLDSFQPHLPVTFASSSFEMHDSEMQLQEPTRTLFSARQLHSVPYTVGAHTGTFMPD